MAGPPAAIRAPSPAPIPASAGAAAAAAAMAAVAGARGAAAGGAAAGGAAAGRSAAAMRALEPKLQALHDGYLRTGVPGWGSASQYAAVSDSPPDRIIKFLRTRAEEQGWPESAISFGEMGAEEKLRLRVEDLQARDGGEEAEVTIIPPPDQRATNREADSGNSGQGQRQGGSGSGSSSRSATTAAKDSLGKSGREEEDEANVDGEDPGSPTQKRAAPSSATTTTSTAASTPGGGGGGGVGTPDEARSTRSKAKSAPSRPDGDRVKHFLKSIEDWCYERRKGWWLKKSPDAVAYDISDDNAIVMMIEADAPLLAKFYAWETEEMWTYLTEHCEVGVPCGSEQKGWPCLGSTIACPDKEIFADNKGIISRDELPSFMGRPGTSKVRDDFNNRQKNRECQAEYW
eukprot:g20221.t1